MANSQHTTVQLSALIQNPIVRAAFERAERDNPIMPLSVEPAGPAPVLAGGAAVRQRELELA